MGSFVLVKRTAQLITICIFRIKHFKSININIFIHTDLSKKIALLLKFLVI
jgi:hypothetical protein